MDRGRGDVTFSNEGQESAKMSASPEEQQEQPMPRAQLTLEELQVLRECNQESFWYRCVPLGVAFIGSTQILVNRGFLKPNPRFGALLKNLGAGLLAYIIGKWSYRNVCREKIMQLENSPLADALRRSRGGFGGAMRERIVSESPVTEEAPSRLRRRGALETPTEYRGLDDNLRPSVDRDTLLPKQSRTEDSSDQRLTYEELRRQNRAEYEKKVHTSVGGLNRSQPGAPPPDDKQYNEEPAPGAPKRNVRRNKYGDEMET